MDKPILKTPKLSADVDQLMHEADKVYKENFDGEVWFGRCIFLSWYCERGTCKFCFRSTTKHKIQNPADARRSIPSVLSEAVMIRGFNWRLEFLTGGYGIYDHDEMIDIAKMCSSILGEKIWLNIGVMEVETLKKFASSVAGVVASLETLEPKLHKEVCPDKPNQPYIEMLDKAKALGFKRSITFIIGLGEKRDDFKLLEKFINEHPLDRITFYTLRPVKGTMYEHGPSSDDIIWWIAKTRIAFPTLQIIVGSAAYRIFEISLILKAGANAFTKLPATNIFNTDKARQVEQEVKKAGRELISKFTSDDLMNEADWDGIINSANISDDLKEMTREKLYQYLKKMGNQFTN